MLHRCLECLVFSAVLSMAFLASAPARGASAIELKPSKVPIGIFFDGASVELDANPAAYEGFAVLLTGESGPVELQKIGRVWGFLWMGVGKVSFDSVPIVYRLESTATLRSLASAGELSRLELGYDVLFAESGGDSEAFGELVKLKEDEGLYGVDEEALPAPTTPAGPQPFHAVLDLPARIPQGEYHVELIGFSHERGTVVGDATLEIAEVGLARDLRELAEKRGTLYGCAAVLVAIVAGFGTGLVFRSGAGAGH